jgi:amino acid adenylation domain-containing protein
MKPFEKQGQPSSPAWSGDQRVDIVETALVPDRVSICARCRSQAPAILAAQESLTYAQLNALANRLAKYFLSAGIGRESVVALWLSRSSWFIVSALAAFKAGAAYLPLDVDNPQERLRFVVKDCKSAMIVTESMMARVAGCAETPLLILDQFVDTAARFDPTDPVADIRPDDLAYVIYTSGSTGTPKGVEITHANLANLIAWHNRAFRVSDSDRASQLAGLGFDASVWEMWPYLAAGSSLHLAPPDTLSSPEDLRAWLIENAITISFVPTPTAERLLRMDWPTNTSLRVLLTGGDTLHARPKAGLPFAVFNNYGPTECTVVSTSAVVFPPPTSGLPSIGVPIDNTNVYLLDQHLRFVPPGEVGELYISGLNVGRGYRNRPDLTRSQFIPSPLRAGDRLYKTGDLGRYLPNGEIAFLGRVDNQLKIRGFRIEPDEIVAVLNDHPSVKASAVIATEDGPEKHLIAYLVAETGLTRNGVQDFLLERLPSYMVPSTYVLIDELPITANGKISRSDLPAPNSENALSGMLTAPVSPVETRLSTIITELLKVQAVGLDDDFFLLGGHSLLGTQLIARIREAFDVELPLRTLFEGPTVRDLVKAIESALVSKIAGMTEEEVQQKLHTNMNHSTVTESPRPTVNDPRAGRTAA